MNVHRKQVAGADDAAVRLVEDLCNLLDVERFGTNLFRGAVSAEPWPRGGRGLSQGRIFARDGRLVASVAQEGLIRPHRQITDP